jgi:hypothetical protein
MTVFCQLHEAGGLSCVSYMRQYDGYLSVIIDKSVSYMKQDDGYLSAT